MHTDVFAFLLCILMYNEIAAANPFSILNIELYFNFISMYGSHNLNVVNDGEKRADEY